MPNRRRRRKIEQPPIMEGFKPFGTPMRNLERVTLLFEEYEAIRLIDHENLNQEEAAEKMEISRPTFTRVYKKARKTIANALVEGKAIMIEGGTYTSKNYWAKCNECSTLITASSPVEECPNCRSKILKKGH